MDRLLSHLLASRLLTISALAITAAGCSGGNGKGSITAPTSGPFNETIAGTINAFATAQHLVSVPRSGTARISLTWTGGGDLDMYLTSAACNSYPPGNCPLLASSRNESSVVETMTRAVSEGEQLKVWVDSFVLDGPRGYTITFIVN